MAVFRDRRLDGSILTAELITTHWWSAQTATQGRVAVSRRAAGYDVDFLTYRTSYYGRPCVGLVIDLVAL